MRTDFAEKPTLEEIAGALRCIPPKLAYGDWLKICAAVHAAYPGEDGVNLIEQWSPGYDGEVAEKFKSFDGTNRSTVATLFHFAKQHGWTKGRTAPVTYKQTKPAPAAYEWDEPKQRAAVSLSHTSLVTAGTAYAGQAMEYLQQRCIALETIAAFGVGYSSVGLPHTWDGKTHCYPKQLAVSLPWFDHDGALIAVKYRFIKPHTYTDKDGHVKAGKNGEGVRFTSRGQIDGNVFGWQALRGADVLIICEGEMNALSLWQASRGAVDVLSMGSESTTKKLPPRCVDLAHRYTHRIVWADKKEVADAAALQIGAASMTSPKGMDANDLLKAGKLGDLLTAMLLRLGVSHTSHTPVTHQCVITLCFEPGCLLYGPAGATADDYGAWLSSEAACNPSIAGDLAALRSLLATQPVVVEHPHATTLTTIAERRP